MNNYKSFFDSLEAGFCIIEVIFNEKEKPVDYRFLEVNPAFEKQTGFFNPVGKTARELVPDLEEHWLEFYGQTAMTGIPARFKMVAPEAGRYYDVTASKIGKPDERKLAVLFWDIRKEKEMEDELLRSEKNYFSTLDNLLEGCALINHQWEYLFVNRKYAEQISMKQDEIIGRKVLEIFPEIEKTSFYLAIKKCMEEQTYQSVEDSFTFSEGSVRWIILFANPVPEGVFILVVDVTRRKTAELNLQHALAEKELLLKELYHRTKNNMQVISSLLNIRSERFRNEQVRDEFTSMSNRIQSMSLVHEKLYQTKSLTELNLKSYIIDLVNLVKNSRADKTNNIEIQFTISDYNTSVDTATTLGLIITEVIVNTFKYAFPDNRKGRLSITLVPGSEKVQLTIKDNGVGISSDLKEESLGMYIVKSLIEDQLNGSYIFDSSSSGTSWVISF